MPLILCVALGTGQGGHSGSLPLSAVLNRYGDIPGIVPISGCGNEAGSAHHYFPGQAQAGEYRGVEILVPENCRGFFCELWGQAPRSFL